MKATERETLEKVLHDMGFAADNLRAVLSTDDVLLADFAMELLEQVNKMRQRLERVLPIEEATR